MRKRIALKQRNEFLCCHSCLPKDGAKRPTIKRFVVGNHNLRKWLITPKNDVASVLTLELKSLFQECGDALAA